MLGLLDLAGRARRAVRLRLWAARTRLTLRRRGIRFVLGAGRGAGFHRAPLLGGARGGGATGPGGPVVELGPWSDLGPDLVLEVMPGTDTRLRLGDGVRLGSRVRLVAGGGELSVGAWSDVRDG